jgi:hypothetical protein
MSEFLHNADTSLRMSGSPQILDPDSSIRVLLLVRESIITLLFLEFNEEKHEC